MIEGGGRAAAERAVSRYGEHAELYRSTGQWQNRTLTDAFRASAERRPAALAVATIEGALTYAELDVRSDCFALALVDAGLEPGAPVIFQLGNELETVVAWYGALKAGLVPVCSIPNHRLHEVSLIAGATGARAHIFQADYRRYDLETLSAELAERCPSIDVRVIVRGAPSGGARSMEEMCQAAHPARARQVVDSIQRQLSPEGPAVFQLSSGTTGVPKVIPHTHATYLSIAERWSAHLGWDENSVNMHFIPLMHHAGLGTVLTPTHFAGGTFVLGRGVDAKLLVDLIERYRVTAMHFNAAAARPVLDYSSEVACDFSSLTHFICTWGPAQPELAAEVEERLGAVGLGSFGMGEGVHMVARQDDPVEIRRHTCGWVIGPHDEVVLREPGGDAEVPDGELGEFTFRGPSVIRAYLSDEHTAKAFTEDGYLRSGDLGRVHLIDGRRCYTLDGRLKDQISRGGEKFMADELESLLLVHPDVREVAAIGLPDPILGERVCVVVVPEAGCTAPAEELRLRLVEHLDQRDVAKFKWPERLVLADELPKTGTGKVKKDVLREQVLSGAEPNEVRS
jgi:non-ribosomal peptide synthetase component E (peptide arylation enzyme)